MAKYTRYIPISFFILIAIILSIAIFNEFLNKKNNLDSSNLPSPFIGKDLPKIETEDFYTGEKVFITDLSKNKVRIINVWASWCPICLKEHDMLMKISKNYDIAIIGINYKDSRYDANIVLNSMGNPFTEIVFDERGDLGLELGVYATPETFLVNDKGIIVYKHIGEINENAWNNKFLPLIL